MGLVELLSVLIVLFMLLAMPIAYALIFAAMVTIWYTGSNLMIVPQQILGGIDSFTLLAVPFFLLAGDLMTAGGMTNRLLNFTNALVGRFRGGLAMSNVASATLLAGISGSAVADTSALGKVLIPGMIKAGYSPAFSAALTAAANIVGPIIPPSIAFILIGVLTNQSITRLFLAGLVPGLVYSLAMLIVAGWISRKRNYPTYYKASAREVVVSFREAIWALMMPVLIIVGIRSGVFNVTECSAVAVVYALFVGTVVYRELSLKTIWSCMVSTGRATAVIMIVLGGAQIVSWLLAYENIPQQIADAMLVAVGAEMGVSPAGQHAAAVHRHLHGKRSGHGHAGAGAVPDRQRARHRSGSFRGHHVGQSGDRADHPAGGDLRQHRSTHRPRLGAGGLGRDHAVPGGGDRGPTANHLFARAEPVAPAI